MRCRSQTLAKSYVANCATSRFLRRQISFRELTRRGGRLRSNNNCAKNTATWSTVSQASFREGRMSELTLAGLNGRIGQELGVSDWVAIDQPRIDTFASCTGDRQLLHVDVDPPKHQHPFPCPTTPS